MTSIASKPPSITFLEWLDEHFSDVNKQIPFVVTNTFDGIISETEDANGIFSIYKPMDLKAIRKILNDVEWRQAVPKVGAQLLSHRSQVEYYFSFQRHGESMTLSVPTQPDFQIGGHYVRKELHNQFKGNRQKGISSPAAEDFVFIFTGPSGQKHGYDDEFLNDGTLIYYGEGRFGDMEFTPNNGNTKVRDHVDRGLSLYVFEETSEDGVMSYVGEYKYEKHDWTTAPDDNDAIRDAIRFRLVPAEGITIKLDETKLDSASELALFAAAQEAAEHGTREEEVDSSNTRQSYLRSDVVKRFARRSADGVCQGCGDDAPFIDTNGDPFLEVHHLHRLSDGGPDRPENVIALCPNCHRRRHNGRDGDEFNRNLIEKAEQRNRRLKASRRQ